MKTCASSLALALASVIAAISPAAADVTAVLTKSGPNPTACVEYSYVPTGVRLDLQIPPGNYPSTPGNYPSMRIDQLPPGHSQVQVYTLQSGPPPIGASVSTFPPHPYGSDLASVVFAIRGRDAVVTVVYADGSSASKTMQLSSTNLPCPSPK
jgi:hypothetical protein